MQLLARMYQTFLAGIHPPHRPLGVALFLGPTGSGKTRVVEAAAEVIFGNTKALLKIDCAEYQQPHELAKLVGSPAGYVGHRETAPLLSQENINRFESPANPLSLILFDEIEKASDALWQLLLGVLDRGRLSLGDNRSVDFSRAIIVLTSNLGAREMSDAASGSAGFSHVRPAAASRDRRLSSVAIRAARQRFSPEFMNRIDQTVVFRSLSGDQLRQVVELELRAVQDRILDLHRARFVFECADAAKDLLLREGTDPKYGARHLKRAIERLIVAPLSSLIATGQIGPGDIVDIEVDATTQELVFEKHGLHEDGAASACVPPAGAAGAEFAATAASTAMQQLAATMQRAGLL